MAPLTSEAQACCYVSREACRARVVSLILLKKVVVVVVVLKIYLFYLFEYTVAVFRYTGRGHLYRWL